MTFLVTSFDGFSFEITVPIETTLSSIAKILNKYESAVIVFVNR